MISLALSGCWDVIVHGVLSDLTERQNLVVQDQVLSQQDFAQKMHCRQLAAHAFIESHAHETWKRAVRGRNRPMRGPYVVGQSVYVFRRGNRGLLSTRHGVWRGPGKIVGTESFRQDSPMPRVIWVVINEDELAFRSLAKQYEVGHLPAELDATQAVHGGPAGRFYDLTQQAPQTDDFELAGGLPEAPFQEPPAQRRRIHRSGDYWHSRAEQDRAAELPSLSPRLPAQPRRLDANLGQEGESPSKSRRLDPAPEFPEREDAQRGAAELRSDAEIPLSEGDDPLLADIPAYRDLDGPQEGALCCEVSCEIGAEDLTQDVLCLWEVLEECAAVQTRAAQNRRVEVFLKKLTAEDRDRFKGAMSKEWQSWLENKVTTIVKAKGVDRARIIGSRWVLT